MEKEKLLNKLYFECIKDLEQIGINFTKKDIVIEISNKSKKRYGCCKPEQPDEEYKRIEKRGYKYIIRYDNYKKYTIQISRWVLDLEEYLIKNTIIHELIHCLPQCNNHGKHFKYYAKIINEKLDYNISIVGNKKEDFLNSNLEYSEEEKNKYKIICKRCGSTFYRRRLNKNFTKKYRCAKCMGKLEVNKEDFT